VESDEGPAPRDSIRIPEPRIRVLYGPPAIFREKLKVGGETTESSES